MNNLILPDGRCLELEHFTYPIASGDRQRIINLIQKEWPRSNVDWLQSMRGCYSDVLTMKAVLGSIEGDAVATASVVYPVRAPEGCIVMDVITVPEARRLGIARTITNRLLEEAFEAGCRVAHLGNMPVGPSVYETIGFERLSGVFMRRPAVAGSEPEREIFAIGQQTSVRPLNWGDLPGFVCLHAQPLNCALLNHRSGLVSRKFLPPTHAVGSFSSVWDDVESAQGVLLSLVGGIPTPSSRLRYPRSRASPGTEPPGRDRCLPARCLCPPRTRNGGAPDPGRPQARY